jgi:hypothetical protein
MFTNLVYQRATMCEVLNQTQVRQVSCVVHQEMYKTQIDELMARKGE